ncbi:hypothetical protein ABFX02_11G082100 [Erythranthe guttata]
MTSVLRLISRKVTSKSLNHVASIGFLNRFSTKADQLISPKISPPWLMLPPSTESYNFYSLAQNKVVSLSKVEESHYDDYSVALGSSHGWLVLLNKRNCDLLLSNPVSNRHIKLPPIHILPIPKSDLRRCLGCVSKVIINCSPDDLNCRAVMIFGPSNRLAFCVPGHNTSGWTPIGATTYKDEEGRNIAREYEDVVYSTTKHLFFGVTKSGDFEAWDLRDPLAPKMTLLNKEGNNRVYERNYVYKSDKELHLKMMCEPLQHLVMAPTPNNSGGGGEEEQVLLGLNRYVMIQVRPDGSYVDDHEPRDNGIKYPYMTIAFDVHKYDVDADSVTYMDGSLDGLSLFVGGNHSFALPAAGDYPELKPNSIYFTDSLGLQYFNTDSKEPYGGHDIGIYDYRDATISPCYYPCDVKSLEKITPPPIWFTPAAANNIN